MKAPRNFSMRISVNVLFFGGTLVESFAPQSPATRRHLKRVHQSNHYYVSRSFFGLGHEEEVDKARISTKQQTSSLQPGLIPFSFRRQEPSSQAESKAHVENALGMSDPISFLQPKSSENTQDLALASTTTSALDEDSTSSSALDINTLLLGLAGVLLASIVVACSAFGLTANDVIHGAEAFVANPQESLHQLLDLVKNAGSAGPLYFGLLYFLAEILAIPATPLTLSAGFLFGTTNGVITVLIAATFASSFGFVVGKTVLRGTVENILKENPKYAKLDKAIGEKGFPLLLLVRLTPLFPFSLSNYVYGASSVKFPDYFWGTLLGFLPGTVAYVYTGEVGQALTTGEGSQPWYVYVGGLAVLTGVLKLVTDVATGIVSALDDEEEEVV